MFIEFLCVVLFLLILLKIIVGNEYRFIFPYFRNTVWTLDEYYTNQISKFELKTKVYYLCEKYGNDRVMDTIKYILNYIEKDISENLHLHDFKTSELEEQRLELIRDMKSMFKLL